MGVKNRKGHVFARESWQREKSLQCHVSLLSNGRRRQFIFVFLHLIPETSRPGGGCSDKCLEFFWPVLHWQANKLQNNFIWMPKKSCDSRLLPQEESVQHCFFSIHQTHKGLLCRVFFFCSYYGLCLNQPKMSAYLTSFARLARLYTVIAICNIALSVYYQFFLLSKCCCCLCLCCVHCNL